jgi:hypothetical protein
MELDIPTLVAGIGSTYYIYIYGGSPHGGIKQYNKFRTKKQVPQKRSNVRTNYIYIYV